MMEMDKDCERILITEEELREKVKEAAAWLDKRFEGSVPLAVSVLKGSVIFFCDLVRAMKIPVQMDFMTVSSYGNSSERIVDDYFLCKDFADKPEILVGVKHTVVIHYNAAAFLPAMLKCVQPVIYR